MYTLEMHCKLNGKKRLSRPLFEDMITSKCAYGLIY